MGGIVWAGAQMRSFRCGDGDWAGAMAYEPLKRHSSQ